MTPQELKFSILKLAFSGKLVPQLDSELITDKTASTIENAPFDVPDSWKWKLLGKECEMYTGDSISESVKKEKYVGLKEGFDYIGTKDVTFEHTIVYNNGVRIPFENSFKRAYSGCVLMCIEGGSAGRKIAILDREVCFGNKLCMFKTSNVYNKFLFYYLQSSEFKTLFADNIAGIIGGVSIKKLKNILIPIPPVEEQKRIVAKIETILPLIDRYENAWVKLESFNKNFPAEMEKSILQYAIRGKLLKQKNSGETGNDLYNLIQKEKNELIKQGVIQKSEPLAPISPDEIPFEIPSNWKWCRWGDLSFSIQYGYNASAKNSGRIRMVRISDIQDGEVLWDDIPFCDINEEVIKSYLLEENDILFARTGGTVGKSFLVKKVPYESVYAGYLIRTRYSKLLVPEYLKAFMGTKLYWDQLHEGTIATAQPNCNGKTLSKMLIPLPPREEQIRIVNKLKELLPLCKQLVNNGKD